VHADPDSVHLRLLVAADASIDPHRLVKLCSDHADGGAPNVSLLVPADPESRRSSRSPACAESLLCAAIVLLDGAGIRLEDIALVGDDVDAVGRLVRAGCFDALLVCPARREQSSRVLSLAVRLAREHGLAVDGDTRQDARHPSWLRRVVDPLLPSRPDRWGGAA
jgi:hypothetical protein